MKRYYIFFIIGIIFVFAALTFTLKYSNSSVTQFPTPTLLDKTNSDNSTTIVAVGDIACASDATVTNQCADKQVAQLTKSINPQKILLLGDIQYEKGKIEDFQKYFDKNWSDQKAKFLPTPGNHEYFTPSAKGYYDYFSDYQGVSKQGYYHFEIDGWQIYALNSNCAAIGGCDKNSDQYKWLANELVKANSVCQLAFWHEPLYSSGLHGGSTSMQEIFELLYQNKVEIVLNGHDHTYERIKKADGYGNLKDDGVRSFVVGTGGRNLYPFLKPTKLSEVKQNTDYGVLKMQLLKDSYQWEFASIKSDGFKDTGNDRCI